jgi:dynein light intermediate chain 1
VPAGWDSWGKIAVLRDGFDAKAWGEAWERDLSSDAGIDLDDEAGARKLYAALVQDQGPKPTPLPPLNNPTPEQAFLAKNYDENARRADRDPRGIFRTPTDASAPPSAGLVGPLGSSSFSLPTVERALAEMEGSGAGASLGGLGLGRRAGAPTSPILGSAPSPTQHEVLQNFFKSLLNSKDRAASPGTSAVSPGAATGKPPPTGPRTSGGGAGASGASASGDSQTDPDAGSGAEDA